MANLHFITTLLLCHTLLGVNGESGDQLVTFIIYLAIQLK